jgi:Uma2 family endonuclease
MATFIRDQNLEKRLQTERAASGADRYDEVWEGTYMIAPAPDNEHQFLVGMFTRILYEAVVDKRLGIVLPGTNVSDRVEGWGRNYRVPDIAVFLNETAAVNYSTFWFGGPDFAIEILSQDDQTREKLEFYSKVRTRELLIVDRDPWRLEFYRLRDERLTLVSLATANDEHVISSETLAIELRMQAGSERPEIVVTDTACPKIWTV